ncbi:sensor histidine kinase [Reichenbachiella versicolor]|uniref:sensor histidine kinase n=1 Tax=Reichenbachiella versicolor TaxID=1821036 RepID=UPI000D6E9BE6|nr:histidine kinase [Reichenbachiella versicolor]
MKSLNKKTLYWICQILGWGTYIFILLFFTLQYPIAESAQTRVILLQFIIGIVALFGSHGVRKIIHIQKWMELTIKKLIPRLLVLNAITAVICIIVIHIIMIVALDWQNSVKPIVWKDLPFYTANLFYLLNMWAIIYTGYHSIENARISRLEKLAATTALKDAELIALKAQINPHFLFNSLNNIKALILEDGDKARNMLTNLSDLLRYSIEFNKQSQVTISEEIEIVKNYLELESIQYDERLKYEVNMNQGSEDCMIPPMVIQTLTENAIKHGIAQSKTSGVISIETDLNHQNLTLRVKNSGRLSPDNENSTGTGIKNALERIKILSSKSPIFTLSEENNLVTATIKIPV